MEQSMKDIDQDPRKKRIMVNKHSQTPNKDTHKDIEEEEEDIRTSTIEGTTMVMHQMATAITTPKEDTEMNHPGEVEASMTVIEIGTSRNGIVQNMEG